MDVARQEGETARDWYSRLLNGGAGRDAIRTAKAVALAEAHEENTKILAARAKAKADGTYQQRPPHDLRRSDAAQEWCIRREAEKLGITFEVRRDALAKGITFEEHKKALAGV